MKTARIVFAAILVAGGVVIYLLFGSSDSNWSSTSPQANPPASSHDSLYQNIR